MSNTVITNYTDLNGPSTKADSSVVVIVNKDGSLSVDQSLLGTLMGTDGQGAGISVVRVGHEGRPDDATDSESDEEKIPHVTLSVDSYYGEPNSIIKYDSGAEMLQSLKIETRENSLVGFHNDHCYTPLTSPSQGVPQRNDSIPGYDEPVIEITHTPPPKPLPQSKKITILEQQIIPKGKKIIINPTESAVLMKGNNVLNKPLPVVSKAKRLSDLERSSDTTESSSISSGESIPDRDSDSDYKDTKDRSLRSVRKTKVIKPRILKHTPAKGSKLDPKVSSRLKSSKNIIRKDVREKTQHSAISERKQADPDVLVSKESAQSGDVTPTTPTTPGVQLGKIVVKPLSKPVKKEKKPQPHMTALLSDMTSLFSTPDVIRRVSTDGKPLPRSEKEPSPVSKKPVSLLKTQEPAAEPKVAERPKLLDNAVKNKTPQQKTYLRQKDKANPTDKASKSYDPIPQLDDVALAQILQDTTGISTTSTKTQPVITTANTMNSPGLAGPLSPTLDLLGGLQPEEEGLTEDLLMHVARLVESSENLQEVIDKQVLGKVDNSPVQPPFQQTPLTYTQTPKAGAKTILPRKDPIEIVRRDGRVITLPPIEAPATRSAKRKSQVEPAHAPPAPSPPAPAPAPSSPVPPAPPVSKQYVNKKLTVKKQEPAPSPAPPVDKVSAESQESWNSEDDPYRLWCICRQPHNNRFMICCDGCEDWFHGKCVNITKAMGQQMEEQGIEWRCPNCVKKTKAETPKLQSKHPMPQERKPDPPPGRVPSPAAREAQPAQAARAACIVCKRPARASSIYCSDACILKHAQDSLGSPAEPGRAGHDATRHDKHKSDSRVIVYERKTGRLLAGPNAPTAENLKNWLQKNPTFEVVRPGTLHTIKPNLIKRKAAEGNKVQTTLNFERAPRKPGEEGVARAARPSPRGVQSPARVPQTPARAPQTPARAPPPPARAPQPDTPRPTPSTSKGLAAAEPKKPARPTATRSHSTHDKVAVSPSTSRRKEAPDARKKMDSTEPIRENVRKSLQEHMSIRMGETKGARFSERDIQAFAQETESELHELFGRDVGMKYKAKYRSLMFNIKDRKNLSLWQKICDRKITPAQLVRLSPEEMASQELAQWREDETKHQLELIKKSELDLLAASKTYVLKTHKGEEVMEKKDSVQTELDPEVPIEDVVIALNDSTVGEEVTNEVMQEKVETPKPETKEISKKRDKDKSASRHSKKNSRESKRDSESRKSRSSRRRASRSDKRRSSERERARHGSRPRARRSRSRSRPRSRSRSRSRPRRSRSRSRSRRRSARHAPAPRSPRSPAHGPRDDKPRSRSQEHISTKAKNDSTDSDSIERPKSAMLKEVHPEYDPHEPMITSAFSEEDLRKGGDSFDDSYKVDGDDYADPDFDPTNSFSIDTSVILPTPSFITKQDKVSETESDQEPSSTVENSAVTVWNGCINMVDVARFYVAAHEVSGSGADLEEDLNAELDIVGRINPDTVWEYIGKMKRTSSKDIVILRLQAANDEERMQYIALYSYLSSRNRLGVVKVASSQTVKDFYIVPLSANSALPSVLLPLDGPGLDSRTHLLLAIVIRQRRKRAAPAPAPAPADVVPAKVGRESRKRSYTPPLAQPARAATPPPRAPRPAYTSPALSTSVKDKIAASLAAADDEEAYSPGSSSSSGSAPLAPAPAPAPAPVSAPTSAPAPADKLRCKMEELNRQIEEQKQQILKMAQADSSVGAGEDEAYSPSRPMTPPAANPLADIALPSNLHEILATIKQRSETTTDVDMRNLPLPP